MSLQRNATFTTKVQSRQINLSSVVSQWSSNLLSIKKNNNIHHAWFYKNKSTIFISIKFMEKFSSTLHNLSSLVITKMKWDTFFSQIIESFSSISFLNSIKLKSALICRLGSLKNFSTNQNEKKSYSTFITIIIGSLVSKVKTTFKKYG